jgi:hypothetical protein
MKREIYAGLVVFLRKRLQDRHKLDMLLLLMVVDQFKMLGLAF